MIENRIAVAAICVTIIGCTGPVEENPELQNPVERGSGADGKADHDGGSEACRQGPSEETKDIGKVDVLLVIDNSAWMEEEQASLNAQLGRLVRGLTYGDRDLDGVQDFPAATDIHLGVISTDLGTAGYYGICPDPDRDFGDDGVLQNRSSGSGGCRSRGTRYPSGAAGPAFLSYVPSASSQTPEEFADDVQCIAELGTNGCGYEQPLEAMLKALVPSRSDFLFLDGSRGNGDVENVGFLRDDSLLVVIVVTDEDDCSAVDTRLFDPSEANFFPGFPNARCAIAWDQNLDALWPIDRYTKGLLALRPGAPDRVIFAGIVGVPVDLAQATRATFDDILEDPRMETRVDSTPSMELVPSCTDESRGVALPPVRIVQTAQAFEEAGSHGVIQSICQADLSPAIDTIVDRIADVLERDGRESFCEPGESRLSGANRDPG